MLCKVRCDQLKNKSSRRVTYGNPYYSIGFKANSIYFLNDHSVPFFKIHRLAISKGEEKSGDCHLKKLAMTSLRKNQ
jgi:hypothetical protein